MKPILFEEGRDGEGSLGELRSRQKDNFLILKEAPYRYYYLMILGNGEIGIVLPQEILILFKDSDSCHEIKSTGS